MNKKKLIAVVCFLGWSVGSYVFAQNSQMNIQNNNFVEVSQNSQVAFDKN